MKEPGKKDLLNALRQLTMLVRLGYPVADGLKNMADDASPWLTRLAEDMEEGDSLADALGRQPRLFSPYFRGLIESAASHPKPDQVLQQLSHWLERSEWLEQRVASILLYPMLLLCLLTVFVTLYALVILPEAIVPLSHDPSWAGLTPALPWLAAVPGILFLVLSLSILSGRPWPPLLWLFPEIRGVRSLACQALWARAMGSLLAAGVPVVEALDQALPIVTDSAVSTQLRQAAAEARKGTPLATALGHCSGLETYLVWSLEGEGEDVASQMLEASQALEREVELRSLQQLRLMAPRALILIGVLCAGALLSFWWPFYTATVNL